MRTSHLLCPIIAFALGMGGTLCGAQEDDNVRIEKTNHRIVRIASGDENEQTEGANRRVVRVFSTSGDTASDSENGAEVVFLGQDGPGAYSYAYGLPRLRGYLGVQLTELTPELRAHFGAPEDAGVLISQIAEDSPAAKAGLRVGDVLTSVDGSAVKTGFDLARKISDYEDGTTVALEIWRDRRVTTLSATVVERERPAIDLGRFVLPDLGRLGEQIKINIKDLPEHVIEIDEQGIHEALRDLQHKFEDPTMFQKFQVLDRNRVDLQERIQELEERLAELEQQLEKLPED